MRRTTVAAVLGLGLALSAGAVALILTSDHVDRPGFAALTQVLVGWSFVGGGLVAWQRRPDNRFGLLLVAVGLAIFASSLRAANVSVPFTFGLVFGDVFIAVFVHALLAFPRGYLEGRLAKAIVAIAYLELTVGSLVLSFFLDPSGECPDCPANAFLLVDSPRAVSVVDAVLISIAIPTLVAALWLIRGRWSVAPGPVRRVLAPVYVTAGISLVVLGLAVTVGTYYEGADVLISSLLVLSFAAVPPAFVLGLVRGRLARAGVGSLLLELGQAREPGELREALARTLGDPTLRLAYWIPESESFADIDGNPIELPGPDGEAAATVVERDGRPVAALIHDRSLEEDPLLVEATATAAALALESERRLAALADERARSRALLDAVPDLMFRMDREGVYLEYKGRREDLAVPPEELIGARAHDVLPRDVADLVVEGVCRAIDTGEVVTGEYTLELAGVARDFEARIVKAGENAVLIVREFTERNRAQAELERLHAELQQRNRDLEHERDFAGAVVDATPSLLALVTPGGYIVRFNSSLEALSGRKDDDLVGGRPFWDVFVAPEEREAVRDRVLEVAAEGGRGEYESTWVSAAGARRRVAWSTTPLRDDRGHPRLLVCGVDITERTEHEEELRRSRARLVAAGDVERRRLERNLHDGAQQRLVSLSLVLRLAHARVASEPEAAVALLGQASEELAQALEELRELARGIHPAVLSDRGLGAALEALVARSQVPVELELEEARLPEPVEAAAYYVVAEALTNVHKYAEASSVAVTIARVNGRAVVEIADDGVGGAELGKGSGLSGLADRVEALDGTLQVDSSRGRGTTIRAEIPCG